MPIINVERLGRGILNIVRDSAGASSLLIDAIKNLHALKVAPVRQVFFRQIYFTGIEASAMVAIMGTLIGIVIITQVTNIAGSNPVLIGKILMWTVVREMGPLFSAIIIIARSSTAIASELGSMQVEKEIESLRVMGISPLNYLIVPRIVGITISVFILTFYFQISAIAGGMFLSSILMDVPFFEHLRGILSALNFFDLTISLLKSGVFGLVIVTVSCYHGLRVKSSITEIPQVTTSAVMQSLFIVLLLDGIITVVSFI